MDRPGVPTAATCAVALFTKEHLVGRNILEQNLLVWFN